MINLDLSMVRGDTRIIDCTVKGVDGTTPYDLTSCTLTFTAKRQITDADGVATFQLTNGAGITITDAPGGLFEIEITPASTYSMTAGATLVCDIQLKDVNARVFTLGKGTLAVSEDVTRAS